MRKRTCWYDAPDLLREIQGINDRVQRGENAVLLLRSLGLGVMMVETQGTAARKQRGVEAMRNLNPDRDERPFYCHTPREKKTPIS